MSRKIFTIFIFTLIICSFLSANSVLAAAKVVSAKLNGASELNVEGGALIQATVQVELSEKSAWRSTSYKFGDGDLNCFNTTDHKDEAVATETFSITAPSKAGKSDVNFTAWSNDDCTNNSLISILSPASLFTSAANFFSFFMESIVKVLTLF